MGHYLLVGASSGIGRQLANRLLEKDDQVSVICRHRSDLPVEVSFFEADVCEWNRPLPDIEGSLDGFVYFPGTINLCPFSQLTLEDFRRDLDINYLGAVRALQNYLAQLAEGASVVLISTVAARLGLSFHTSVSGAKAAVEGLAVALAAELAPKVRVNVVAPSLTDTPLAKSLLDSEAKRESSAKRHPLGRVGKTEDIASAIDFLLSDEASWITGQVLGVDGGLSHVRPL